MIKKDADHLNTQLHVYKNTSTFGKKEIKYSHRKFKISHPDVFSGENTFPQDASKSFSHRIPPTYHTQSIVAQVKQVSEYIKKNY